LNLLPYFKFSKDAFNKQVIKVASRSVIFRRSGEETKSGKRSRPENTLKNVIFYLYTLQSFFV